MPKTATIHAPIEPELKAQAEAILSRLGLTATQAIRLFYRQLVAREELPFETPTSNPETLATFRDSDVGENIVPCRDADDMFAKLGI